jgi:hypothetical protein
MHLHNVEFENIFKGTPVSQLFIDDFLSVFPDSKKLPARHFFGVGSDSDGFFHDHPFDVGSYYYPPNREGRFQIMGVILEYDLRPSFVTALYDYKRFREDENLGSLAFYQDAVISKCCFRCETSYLSNVPEHEGFVNLGWNTRYPFKPEYFSIFLGVRLPIRAEITYGANWFSYQRDLLIHHNGTIEAEILFYISDSSGVYRMPILFLTNSISFLDSMESYLSGIPLTLGNFYNVNYFDIDTPCVAFLGDYMTSDQVFLSCVHDFFSSLFSNSDFRLKPYKMDKGFLVSKLAPTSFFRPVVNHYKNSNSYPQKV